MPKIVFVIGHTQSTCSYITHQLLTFLANYIHVVTWCTSQSSTPPSDIQADIYSVSNSWIS